jgi:hypothetical protein
MEKGSLGSREQGSKEGEGHTCDNCIVGKKRQRSHNSQMMPGIRWDDVLRGAGSTIVEFRKEPIVRVVL